MGQRATKVGDRLAAVVLAVSTVYGAFYLLAMLGYESWTLAGATDWIGNDFFVFWTVARAVLTGAVADLYDPAALGSFQLTFVASESFYYPWVYPPHGIFVVLPFGLLPYAAGYLLWVAVTFALYLVLGTGLRPTPLAGFVLLVSPATVVAATAGQNGLLTAGLFMGALLLVDRRPVLAGVLVGLLSFKPQVALLLPVILLAQRAWSTALMAVATAALAALAATVAFGAGIWADFLAALPAFRDTMAGGDGVGPLVRQQPTVTALADGLGLPKAVGGALQLAVAVLVAGVLYVVYRRGRDRGLQAAAAAFGVLLAAPYAVVYDLPVAALGVVMAARHGMAYGFRWGQRPVLLVTWWLPVATMPLADAGLPLAPLVLMLAFLTTAAAALAAPVGPVADHPPSAKRG